MPYLFSCLLAIILLLYSCASVKPVEPVVEEETLPISEEKPLTPEEEENQLWEEIRKSIALSSPESLRWAYSELSGSSLMQSDEGRDLSYTACQLFSILYPLLPVLENSPVAPPGSIYPVLFDQVKKGIFPLVERAQANFLTLLIPPLSVLYTSNSEVLNLSRESLMQTSRLIPQSVLPPLLLGLIWEKNNEFQRATEYYTQALEISPLCYPATVGLARIARNGESYSKVLELLNPLTEDYGWTLEFYSLIIEAHLNLGNLREAGQLAERAIPMAPDSLRLIILRAQILEAQGNNEQAKKLITVVERQNYQEPGVFLVKARILIKEGAYIQASELLRGALNLYPGNPKISDLYAQALIKSGRLEEGRNFLSGFLEKNPTRLSSITILLDEAIESKRWEAAEELLERALTIEETPALWRRGFTIFFTQGKFAEALLLGEKLKETSPDNVEDWYPSIRSLIALGRPLDAQDLILLAQGRARTAYQRSELYYLLSLTQPEGETKLESLRRSLLENLQNFNALMEIGQYYRRRGDVRQAYRYLKQASVLKPEDQVLERELQELEDLINR